MTFLPQYAGSVMENFQSWTMTQTNDTFPIIYSTLAPQAVAELAFSYYDIEVTKNCQFWHRGLSDVYLIETITTPYIFRISHCHWRFKEEIDFELELLDFLFQRQVPVAAPIRTRDGQLSVEINAPEGKRYGVLFSYAPGEVALGDLNIKQGHSLGETVARLHQTAREFQPLSHRQPLTLEYLLDDSLPTIAPFLHHRSNDLQYLLETIAIIKQQVESLPSNAPHWGICWGDPHSGNVHFTLDEQMTLFDFDQCGYGWRVFDVAKFLQVSLQTGLSRTVRESFLQGYDEIESLSNLEWSVLQALTQTAYIWSWAINLNNTRFHNYSRLDDSYFTQRLATLKRLRSKDWQLF